MSREWMQRLRYASYGGVSFWVESDKVETGQRLVIHEFPKRDAPYVEPMGQKANKISVTAYMVGANSDSQQKSLMSVCGRAGAKSLNLPIDRFQAHCESCSRSYERDRMGFIAFDLSLVRDDGGGLPSPVAYLAGLVPASVGAVIAAAGSLFDARVRTIGRAGYVRDAAQSVIYDVAVEFEVLRGVLPLDADVAPAIARRISDLANNSGVIVDVGSREDQFTATSFSNAAATSSTGVDYVDEVFGIAEDIRLAALPEDAVRELPQVLELRSGQVYRDRTPGLRQIARNDQTLAQIARVAVLAAWVTAMVVRPYDDRRSAIQARADIADYFERELIMLDGAEAHELYVALVEMRGYAVAYLSRALTDLTPIVEIEGHLRKPSLWWANTLYGDAGRAEELAKRNRVKHAGFMPLAFEALAE